MVDVGVDIFEMKECKMYDVVSIEKSTIRYIVVTQSSCQIQC